jgi:hypothetical protein
LRVYHSARKEITDLDFLAFFPSVRRLAIQLYWLSNIDGFQAVEDLDELTFGWTDKKSYSLRFLERFVSLRRLYVEGHKKDLEVVASLPSLRELTLRSITLSSTAFLLDIPNLQHLDIKLGGTADLRELAALIHLKHLELWRIKGLIDLSFIGHLVSLETLFLQTLNRVVDLPSFRNLQKLRSVVLETMKGLVNLQAVAEAPALESLSLIDMPGIDPKSLRCFVGHPRLRRFHPGLGSIKRNAYAEALVGLPPSVWLPPGAREKAELEILTETAKRAVN